VSREIRPDRGDDDLPGTSAQDEVEVYPVQATG
jgi:hypothetical protein